MTGAAADTPATTDEVERRLDELEAASQQRRAELRELAASLPAATSRRAYLAAMVRGLASAPEKGVVARRTVAKVLRAPADLYRALRRR